MADDPRASSSASRASRTDVWSHTSSARTRDVAAAEDALGDALVAALATWPRDGVPSEPEAWLLTAARRRLIDGRGTSACAPKRPDHTAAGAKRPGGDRRGRVSGRAAEAALRLRASRVDPRHAYATDAAGGIGPRRGDDRERLPHVTGGHGAALEPSERRGFATPVSRSRFPIARAAARGSTRCWTRSMPPTAAAGTTLRGPIRGAPGSRARGDLAGTHAGAVLPDEPEARGLLALMLHCEARRPGATRRGRPSTCRCRSRMRVCGPRR